MAGEESAIEAELQAQLDEQAEALEGVRQLVELDPSSEAAALLHELAAGIRDTEEGLFGLKRQRLLSQLDAMQASGDAAAAQQKEQQQEGPDPRGGSVGGGAATGPSASHEPGTCCVFRHTDGRHYFGRVLEAGGTTVWVQFAHPTR